MTNITLSIEDSIYKKMKKHSEIKWSEFVRKAIKSRVAELEQVQSQRRKVKGLILADERLLGKDWLSAEDNEAWKDL